MGEDQSIESATSESIGRLALANVNPPPIPPILLPTCPSFPTHPPAQHTPLQPVASTLLLLPGKIPRWTRGTIGVDLLLKLDQASPNVTTHSHSGSTTAFRFRLELQSADDDDDFRFVLSR